jgi:hypothetical protein
MALKKGQFPSPTELLRVQTLGKFERLYENEGASVLPIHEIIRRQFKKDKDLIYLSHAIPSKVSDFYGDFVHGDDSRLVIESTEDGGDEAETVDKIVTENRLTESVNDIAVEQSEFGFTVLIGYVKDGSFRVQRVNADQYFPQADGSIVFATYIERPDSRPENRQFWLYTQQYFAEKAGTYAVPSLEGMETLGTKSRVRIERRLWTTRDGRIEDQIPLSAYDGSLVEDEAIDGLDAIPAVQIDNGRRTKWGFGKSDYHDIMPQLAEINERSSHVAIQLLKNLDAKMVLPDVTGIKDSKGNPVPFDALYIANKEQDTARYITNDNTLIEEAFKHIDRQIHLISWITGVPVWEMLDSSMPERVDAMKIKLFNAERKTQGKRAKIRAGFEEIIKIGFKMLGKEMKGGVRVTFGSVIPSDPVADAQVESEKVAAGLSSKFSAIKRLENYTPAEVDAEMAQIAKEATASGVLDANDAPTL